MLLIQSETSKTLFKDEKIDESKVNHIVSESAESDRSFSSTIEVSLETHDTNEAHITMRIANAREMKSVLQSYRRDRDIGKWRFCEYQGDNARADITDSEGAAEWS